ncbi:MAG: DUF5658 family protein [Planctomycetota bacterium]
MDLVDDQNNRTSTHSEVMRWSLWFVSLNLVDGFQTSAFVKQQGLSVELNPWMRWVLSEHSTHGMWSVKFLIIVLVLVLFRKNLGVLRAASIGLAIVVAMNFLTMGIFR